MVLGMRNSFCPKSRGSEARLQYLCDVRVVRTSFWWQRVYEPFNLLLRSSNYSESLQMHYLTFIATYVMPALGPAPSEFTTDNLSPSSYMGDDHTPIELSWVLHPSGKHTVRFTMEPLSKLNGSPTESKTWMEFLQALGRQGRISDFNLEWAKICLKTLVYDGHLLKNDSQHHSQFSIGKLYLFT